MTRTRVLILGLVAIAFIVACGHAVYRAERVPPEGPSVTDDAAPDTAPWVVDASSTIDAIANGALVLDVRAPEQFGAGHITGAINVSWQVFSAPGEAERGDLHPDDGVVQAAVDALGVRGDTPVRVVGDPVTGWGEDGRIVWTLRTLGHDDVALVDGGHAALVSAGVAVSTTAAPPPSPEFTVARDPRWAISTDGLRALAGADGDAEVVIIDAREAREYAGETPYGETRGGHIPGAVHLHYRSLLTGSGYLLPRAELIEVLSAAGISPEIPTVVYCTGGVRSGWFVAVLIALGHADVRNYAGSMWAWSAGPADAFPLEVD